MDAYGEGKSTIKRTRQDLLFDRINMLIWILILIIIIYPLWLILVASFSSADAITGGKVFLWPVDFSPIAYSAVFNHKMFLRSYLNSFVYTIAGTALSVMITMMASYALTRRFPGKKAINFYFIFTMFFSGGLIPQFLVNSKLGLYDTVVLMIIINALSVWNLMIARTYISSNVPNELYEAAVIDGADHFKYFFRVVLPLSGTIIAVMCVYYGMARWNDYFTALVYLKTRTKYPLQLVLRDIIISAKANASSDELLVSFAGDAASLSELRRKAEVSKYCCVVVSTIPTVVLYIFLQKYFVKGVMLGSLKG